MKNNPFNHRRPSWIYATDYTPNTDDSVALKSCLARKGIRVLDRLDNAPDLQDNYYFRVWKIKLENLKKEGIIK